MTSERKTILWRRFARFIGWTDVFVVVLLAVLGVKVAAQVKRRIVYNYDPTTQMTLTLDDHTNRISKIEGQVEDLKQRSRDDSKVNAASNMEGRISRLEATQDINKQLLIGISVAVGLMLIETAQRRLSKT